ncbi:IQ calmodulin-binding motif domain protein [Talaromyces stipitatus ATCC 10500]|uniref:IQ calmodulin-binding motif domain protein n=1 Tax=Talaromyces stipitatus (strain ATCC 10500 / CBS 375.48 / QM 6759 / NRRL 1006) TaxID=441959 RepID=B8M726_TALSN|nr:IQ calmodulin-binding motif domain protein [Talaromyces stipitatus ATCC 10500]EED20246.1 IQ calmodulin-binding motif domain protein [Talaromyces stipitatus ATCC 10500]
MRSYHAAMIRRNSDLEIHLPDADAPSSAGINSTDVEMLTSDDEKRVLSLPPHIAARFYRRSASARRASDKLSRRGSVSSIHSHHSNTSAHGGPQSDHVAQHLRRASILESRKARLADRAAYAEKVRLRAAVAKAATRNLQREERALAAQQARERLLAEITAKCEDEVRRAKKKAEETRELKAAKYARLRLEMAEKFAEAEKRRLQYQQTHRRPRTASLPSGEESKMVKTVLNSLTRDAAARIIQKAWKNYVARKVMGSFRSLNLSREQTAIMSFDDLSSLLSEDTVLETMGRVLRLCGLQDMDGGPVSERGAVRTFLSSYLILSHPSSVMSSGGEQEQDLTEKARDLVVSFEQITERLLKHQSITSMSSELQVLREAYGVFFSAFHAWKTHDSTVLIEIMLAQFVELELIWQTVKEDRAGGAADEYYQGIRHNQIMLLARLKRLAGSDRALDMVKEALRKAKREKKRSKSSKQSIPRSAAVLNNADAHADSVSSPISETFNNVESAVLHELDKQRLSPHESFTKALTALPENRVLVHELLINREFRIEQTQYTAPRQQLMKHMTDMMRSDVDAGLGTKWIVAMATVIQDRLLRSLRPGNSLHVLISEALDPKLIENQCNAGTFSYDFFFEFMSRILPQLCAPARDAEVKAFAEDKSADPIDRLSKLMGIIDLLSLDHTNFMIQVAAPQLIQEAPGYEQRTFQKGLEDGTINLDKTRRFWQKNHNLVVDDMKRRDPEIAERQIQPPAAKVYAQGLVDLVLSNAPVPSDLVPETLELDNARLEKLHMTAFKIAATAAVLLTAKNLLKRDVRSQWKAEADRILSLDFAEIKPERIQSIIESTRPMPAAARIQLLSTMRRVLNPVATATTSVDYTLSSQMPSIEYVSGAGSSSSSTTSASTSTVTESTTTSSSSSFTDPVARLMLSRLRTHILSRLSAASASERVRATTTASQSLAAAGMPEFVNEVGKLVDELSKVRDVDWTCHSLVYERVISESVTS